MVQLECIGEWNGVRRIPQIALDYNGIQMSETAGQPATNIVPGINLVSTLIICDDAVASQIEADNDYLVLWSEAIVNGT